MAPLVLAAPRAAAVLNIPIHLPNRRLLDPVRARDPSINADETPESVVSRLQHSPPPVPDVETRGLSPTIPSGKDHPSRITERQNVGTMSTIPAGYGATNGPDPGTVAGITLGAVGGFVLLLYFIYFCINIGNPDTSESIGTASVVTRKTRSHRHHGHRSRGRATVEVRTTTRPVVVEEAVPRVERVVVEERRREVSRGPPPPRVVPDDDEDEVVVIEEHSPPRRHRSSQRRSSDHRRDSTYREVDPDRFAGGEAPYREVRRSSGSRRR